MEDLAAAIRDDDSDLWRSFWNEDQYGRLTKPKPEQSCRDVLLADLRHRLPTGVEVIREMQHAAGHRVDIEVISHQGFTVPIEVKKSFSDDLWTAATDQLHKRYCRDPKTDGYGVYLVLWFGEDQVRPSPRGHKPQQPRELEQALADRLPNGGSTRILVGVVDVTKPQ